MVHDKDAVYHEWFDKVPYVPFKPEWKVKAIPPFAGAIVRYIVEYNNKSVSIYLDVDCSLGYFGDDEPYWEMYPGYEDETNRFHVYDVENLVGCVGLSLKVEGDTK